MLKWLQVRNMFIKNYSNQIFKKKKKIDVVQVRIHELKALNFD
jgi:hypothetical protein